MAYNDETGLYEGYIYKIWNDVNDKVYVGQTTRNVEHRLKEHIYSANGKKPRYMQILHLAIKEIGPEHFFY